MSARQVQGLCRLLSVLALLVVLVRGCQAQPRPAGLGAPLSAAAKQRAAAARTLAWSAAHLGVREATGRNDGPEVEAFLKVSGNRRGDAWCGAYQAAGQKACGLPCPAGAGGARNWAKDPKRTFYVRGLRGSIDSLKPGHQVMFYYSNLGRIGHIGRAITPTRAVRRGRPARGWYCNEGNTGTGGGREGAGVHLLFRPSTDFYAAANWLY